MGILETAPEEREAQEGTKERSVKRNAAGIDRDKPVRETMGTIYSGFWKKTTGRRGKPDDRRQKTGIYPGFVGEIQSGVSL
jgi:hypothetical protein